MLRSEPGRLQGRRSTAQGRLASLTILSLLLWIAGCQERLAREEPAIPFVFRSLQLSQNDSRGQPAWKLSSPEARYDITRRLAQARDLLGLLYAQGQPLYQLSASSGVVLADGALIQFEGRVVLRRLGRNPLTIETKRLRWYPRRAVMELDQRPVATERDLTISAQRAVFLIEQEKLELRGQPRIRRSPRAAASQRGSSGDLVLNASSADWYPSSGDLVASGPIQAVRTQEPGRPPQSLTASALRGNTVTQKLVLASPVKFFDPAASAQLLAGETSLDLQLQEASSQKPFQGTLGKLQIAGHGFVVRQLQTLVVVQSNCRLRQPGDSLTAERCAWNWTTQAIEAEGAVELRRRASDQRTRASRLTGRMGDNGLAVFTSPGSRVRTQLRLQSQGRPGTPRATPDSRG